MFAITLFALSGLISLLAACIYVNSLRKSRESDPYRFPHGDGPRVSDFFHDQGGKL
jgi:hypothetical protein